MPLPLEGLLVVALEQAVAAPMASCRLADAGARVIKIERPEGDFARGYDSLVHGECSYFVWLNRGKESVILDLTKADDKAILGTMIAKADVFIQNFRPGVVGRLGIDEAALRAVNPGLIYVSVSGFGDTGPYADQKSYDYVVQALSGLAALQTPPGGDPTLVRSIVIDKVTAMTAAQSILAALLVRERGGGGQHIRLSMLDTALSFLWPDGFMQHSLLADDGRVTPAPHMADGYMVRRTRDGHLALMATSERQFPGLCAALGRNDWLTDPRFATLADRETNAELLSDLMSQEIEKHRAADLVDRLHQHDVPCAAVNPLDRVHLDPQVVHNQTLVTHERPWLGLVREARPPARYSTTPTSLGRHAPKLDEHTDEVIAQIAGYEPERIAA